MTPNEKIAKHGDKYVLFYSDWCTWSNKALDLLKRSGVPYRAYLIEKIVKDDLPRLQRHFSEDSGRNSFVASHKTRPIVFKNGSFLGGYDQLAKDIGNRQS